jgi:predicted lactoylglutathione lyase
MLGYVTLGTNDLKKSCAFYDALLGSVGDGRIINEDRFVAWGTTLDKPALAVALPFDGNDATVGNGVMAAFQMDSKAAVDTFYTLAITLGASDEGEPGPRNEGFYAGYFRDLDGNKLNAFVFA